MLSILSKARRQISSVVDQTSNAAITFLLLVAFGRWLPVADFGALMAGYAIWLLFESLLRSCVLVPGVISISALGGENSAYSSWARVGAIFTLACSIASLTIFATSFYFDSSFWSIAGLAATVITFVGCINLLCRRLVFHSGSYFLTSAAGIAALSATSAAVILVETLSVQVDSGSALLLYSLAFLISPAVLLLFRRPLFFSSSGSLLGVVLPRARFISELSAGSLAQYVYNNGVQLLMAVFSSAVSVAAFSATRTLARPLFILCSALSDSERSQAAKIFASGGRNVVFGRTWSTMNMFMLTMLPLVLIACALAPNAMTAAFSGKYDAFRLEAILWILALVPQILSFPFDIALTTTGDSNRLMRYRFEAAIVCLLLFASPLGLGADVTVTWGISSIIGARTWLLFRVISRFSLLSRASN